MCHIPKNMSTPKTKKKPLHLRKSPSEALYNFLEFFAWYARVKIWRSTKIGIFQRLLSIVMHFYTENVTVSHHREHGDAQNQRNITSLRLAIPRRVQFRRILCLVSTGKDLTDSQNWHLAKTIKHSYASQHRERKCRAFPDR